MRNVLITGGSRGIGLVIARRLVAAGYQTIAVARRESEELRVAKAGLSKSTGALQFRACDLSAVDAIPGFVKTLRDEFGAIYGLVNNAGIGTEGLLATMHNSQIEALVRLNVLSPVILTKYVVRHMVADGKGRIVNISSIIASTGYNGLSVYGATKARSARSASPSMRSRPGSSTPSSPKASPSSSASVSPVAVHCAGWPSRTMSPAWWNICSATAAATLPAASSPSTPATPPERAFSSAVRPGSIRDLDQGFLRSNRLYCHLPRCCLTWLVRWIAA
jgi:NADP-dependent 3-hydroxy acid dehydrogenase YdfG